MQSTLQEYCLNVRKHPGLFLEDLKNFATRSKHYVFQKSDPTVILQYIFTTGTSKSIM
jgi:hypothetical protein